MNNTGTKRRVAVIQIPIGSPRLDLEVETAVVLKFVPPSADNETMRKTLLRTRQRVPAGTTAGKSDAVMAYLAAGRATAEALEPSIVRERVLQDPLRALGARLAGN
jgi:hypothetical protein